MQSPTVKQMYYSKYVPESKTSSPANYQTTLQYQPLSAAVSYNQSYYQNTTSARN